MPSQLHESHVLLFRNQPTLAADLIRDALHADVPPFGEARIVSADFTDIQPAEYRADLVVQLFDDDVPVYGIIVEVQLAVDERKHFVWPAYVTALRARIECPVCLLVITADDAVARWAVRSVEIGGPNTFTPYVLGPSSVPEITDEAHALANPELAVLSAMAHGKRRKSTSSARIAKAAQRASVSLDADRCKLYLDLIFSSLSEAARRALKSMDTQTYIETFGFQSDFAKRHFARGEVSGRAALIKRQLTMRFGPLSADVKSRIRKASSAKLDVMGERLLTAHTLEEVLGPD